MPKDIWKKVDWETYCDAALFLDPTSGPDFKTTQQVLNVMALPFAKHFAVMPDAHLGYGMPIGGVLATDPNVVIPYAVGSDQGCGMAAFRTCIPVDELEGKTLLHQIVRSIKARVPVGFNKRKEPVTKEAMPQMEDGLVTGSPGKAVNARYQLGTLGGGNHFIEIQAGDDGLIWIMVHCGSRHMGKEVCDKWNLVAQGRNDRNYSVVPHDWNLAFLHSEDKAFHEYMKDMAYCVEFARLNRKMIIEDVCDILVDMVGPHIRDHCQTMDICHNHAQRENHMGHNYMVHRKGVAGPYYADTVGIIPGSMGTASYIVMAKNDAPVQGLRSTSHGAGRAMGRKAAQRGLDLAEEQAKMEGIIHGLKTAKDLEEAPGSYKDIDKVMKDQEELCVVLTKLRPIASVKG